MIEFRKLLHPIHFYPRSPCGERHRAPSPPRRKFYISIHALLAESDIITQASAEVISHFYPRSPCGERLSFMLYNTSSLIFLSTLSLRRATFSLLCRILFRRYFYPRSPCGERRINARYTKRAVAFLSTLSLRRATIRINEIPYQSQIFLSTLSLRRATKVIAFFITVTRFLSTLSLRRATKTVTPI